MYKDVVKKTVVILGMPRAFSSMTAGGLKEMGVNMGETLIGPDRSNPAGHFENREFVNLNKDIIAWAGGSWMELPPREKILQYPDKERIKSLVDNSKDLLWGWKDPRNAATIELYLPYLDNPIFVVCYREYEEVAKSLLRRDGTPIEDGIKIAKEYHNRIDDFLKRWYNKEV